MTLPASGPITFADINVELSKAANAPISLNDADVRELAEKPTGAISFADLRGKAAEVLVTIAANVNNISLRNYFSAEDWASTKKKRVVTTNGIKIGSTTTAQAAILSGSGWGGTLTLDNYCEIQGAGGVPNSGAGGAAINCQQAGLIINNHWGLRGGGGAGGIGGRGGNGGAGYYVQGTTVREPASGEHYNVGSGFFWQQMMDANFQPNGGIARWGGTLIFSDSGYMMGLPASHTTGGITYFRGARNGNYYGIYRTYPSSYNVGTAGGAGGAGGNGGYGQGSNVNAAGGAGGAAGAAGGTNAGAGGRGGTGGTGGTWGTAGGKGATGATGGGGNSAGGAAGAAGANGGAAGPAVTGSARTVNNFGTINGTY